MAFIHCRKAQLVYERCKEYIVLTGPYSDYPHAIGMCEYMVHMYLNIRTIA